MGRSPRGVEAGSTVHIWQRGNHLETVFSNDAEHRMFLSMLFGNCARYKVDVFGYCLMTNHYHVLAEGAERDSISRAIGRANQEYSVFKHRREGKVGQLWQGRFGSKTVDEAHFWAALCYVERNPVAAGLVQHAWDWHWSSARAHLELVTEGLLDFGRWRLRYDAASWRNALESGLFKSTLEERDAVGQILVSRHPGGVLVAEGGCRVDAASA